MATKKAVKKEDPKDKLLKALAKWIITMDPDSREEAIAAASEVLKQ